MANSELRPKTFGGMLIEALNEDTVCVSKSALLERFAEHAQLKAKFDSLSKKAEKLLSSNAKLVAALDLIKDIGCHHCADTAREALKEWESRAT